MVVSPAPESTMPSIEDEIAEKKAAEAENTNNNEEGENMGMSPMEKMRMFAQEQIEMNNKKIDELKASIAETEASLWISVSRQAISMRRSLSFRKRLRHLTPRRSRLIFRSVR